MKQSLMAFLIVFALWKPSFATALSLEQCNAIHRVVEGDTLSKIALRYYDDVSLWRSLYQFNVEAIGANPDKITVGINIRLPCFRTVGSTSNEALIVPRIPRQSPSTSSATAINSGGLLGIIILFRSLLVAPGGASGDDRYTDDPGPSNE